MIIALIGPAGFGPHRFTLRYDRRVPARRPQTQPESLDQAFASGVVGLREAFDAHGRLVFSICRRALGAEAAKDVTQDVFVSAWRGRDQFDPARGSLVGWLVGITKRRIIDHLRAERRHVDRRADDLSDPTADQPQEQPQVERIVDRMLVVDAMAALPARSREVIELAYVQDLTHHDIAERTGIPLGTVKSDIRRGLVRIREHLESTNG